MRVGSGKQRKLERSFHVTILASSIMLLIVSRLVLSATLPAPSQLVPGQKSYNDLVEDIISDFLNEAGERLKKSKINNLRSVKQTLRFGRRSDPYFAAMSREGLGERVTMDVNNNDRMVLRED